MLCPVFRIRVRNLCRGAFDSHWRPAKRSEKPRCTFALCRTVFALGEGRTFPTVAALIVGYETDPYFRILESKFLMAVDALDQARFIPGRQSSRHRVAAVRTEEVLHVSSAHLSRSSPRVPDFRLGKGEDECPIVNLFSVTGAFAGIFMALSTYLR